MRNINQKITSTPVSKLSEHPENARRGDMSAISASIEANGFYGVVVAQKSTGHVLAGNHRLRAAKAAGAKEVPVAWVDVDDTEAKRILAADNRTSDLGTYDDEKLARLLDDLNAEGELSGTGFDVADLDEMINSLSKSIEVTSFLRKLPSPPKDEERYTRTIRIPTYEPKGETPDAEDLVDVEKYDALMDRIEAADLPDDVREFLSLAATRHIVFRFRRIAEFYAAADAEVQALMEESALVIIDFGKAIEHGFVQMTERLGRIANEGGFKVADGDDDA